MIFAAMDDEIAQARSCVARSMVAGVFCLALAGCATLPDIAPPQAAGKVSPQIVGRSGPLTTEQSKAILQRLSADAGDAGLLQRHTAYEEAISKAPRGRQPYKAAADGRELQKHVQAIQTRPVTPGILYL